MKIKTLAFIAAAVMMGTLFAETTVEGIGVTSAGFTCRKYPLGNFTEGFAIDGIDSATNAVAHKYLAYTDEVFDEVFPVVTKGIIAGYNEWHQGKFNYLNAIRDVGFDDEQYPEAGYPNGRWERSGVPLYHAFGSVSVPTAGSWTLNLGGRDESWARIEISKDGEILVSAERKYGSGDEDLLFVVEFPSVGTYDVEIWQCANRWDLWLELSAAKGEVSTFNTTDFHLVGDVFTFYDVTFNSNGGSFVNPQTVKAGRAVKKPADPFLEGFAFIGWTLNGDPYDFSQPVTSDMTLLATWTDNVSPEIVSVSSSPTKPVIDGTSVEVALNVSAYDADNDALTYAWSLVGEAPAAYSIANADSPSAAATINGPGTFSFKVAVSDGTATVEETIEVVVGISPNATAFSYAGCEYAGAPIGTQGTTQDPELSAYPWGGAYHDGFKAAWRSTSAGNNNENAPVPGRKNLLLDEKRLNAYGLDGYVFPGHCGNGDGTTTSDNVTSGVAYEGGAIVSNVTDYIRSVELFGSEWDGPANYWIDDPRLEVSSDVKDFRPGILKIGGVGTSSYTTFLRIRFNNHVRNHPTVRIGFLSGYGEGFKPKYISVGGTAHEWEGNGEGYGHLTWSFFDIKNAKAGDVVDCAIMGQNQWNTCFIEGIVIDSIEKKSGFAIRIR